MRTLTFNLANIACVDVGDRYEFSNCCVCLIGGTNIGVPRETANEIRDALFFFSGMATIQTFTIDNEDYE
jgi:hypothetical protein